jgi:hypothetical protein
MQQKSRICKQVGESGSEFEDLVNAISDLKSKIISSLEELHSLYDNFRQATPGTKEERGAVTEMSKIGTDMERQYQQIDSHYGWVLASDQTLVNEVLRSRFRKEIDGRIWLKRAIKKLEVTRRVLKESSQRAF